MSAERTYYATRALAMAAMTDPRQRSVAAPFGAGWYLYLADPDYEPNYLADHEESVAAQVEG